MAQSSFLSIGWGQLTKADLGSRVCRGNAGGVLRFPVLHLLVLAAAAALSATLLGPALDGYFILDDFAWLDCARDSTRDLSHLLTLHISNFFRPVVHAVWALVLALWGPSPAAFHWAAVLSHALATTLLAHLVWRLFDDRGLALVCATCFLINPAYSEAVIWASGMTEPIAAATMLATLLAFRRLLVGQGPAWLALALTLGGFLLAHGAKESAVILLPLMGLLHAGLVLRGAARRISSWIYLPFVVLELVYLAAQYHLQQRSYLILEDHYAIGIHGLGSIAGSLWHLLHLTWPPFAAAALAAVVQGVARRPSRRQVATAAVLLAAVAIPTLPYAMFRGGVLASRYFYLPSMALALASGLALLYLFRSRRSAIQILGLVAGLGLALYGVRTVHVAVDRYLRAAHRTQRFVDAAARLPAGNGPVLVLDPLLRGQHLSSAMRQLHPAGERVRFREVTRKELPRLGAARPVWRYTGRGFVRVKGPGEASAPAPP